MDVPMYESNKNRRPVTIQAPKPNSSLEMENKKRLSMLQ